MENLKFIKKILLINTISQFKLEIVKGVRKNKRLILKKKIKQWNTKTVFSARWVNTVLPVRKIVRYVLSEKQYVLEISFYFHLIIGEIQSTMTSFLNV